MNYSFHIICFIILYREVKVFCSIWCLCASSLLPAEGMENESPTNSHQFKSQLNTGAWTNWNMFFFFPQQTSLICGLLSQFAQVYTFGQHDELELAEDHIKQGKRNS